MRRTLWRLAATGGPRDPARLAVGLRIHLAYAALSSLLVQIGARQQAYVALTGCAGCAQGRCRPGCAASLLGRTLAAGGLGAVQPVPDGLARRPYRRAALALPGRAAQPLDGVLLGGWAEARLTLHWQGGRERPLRAAALLVVGAGAPPQAALRARGWLAWPLPLRTGLGWGGAPLPPALPLGTAWPHDPFLLLPTAPPPPAPTLGPPAPSPCDAALADWLHGVLAAPAADPAPPDALAADTAAADAAADSPWPAGPGGLAPAALGALLARLLAEPRLQSSRPGQTGVTKGRLLNLRHPALDEPTTWALLVWLDQAGVLAPPPAGQPPWRTPRPFATTDLDVIAARLRATPLPDDDTVAATGGAR